MKNIIIFFLLITINTQAQVIPFAFIKSSSIPEIPLDYPTVTIGNQRWMAYNLDVTTYSDVATTAIPEVIINSTWSGLSTGARCYYGNNSSNNATYGKLYNWYAVSNNNICPEGSQVPNNNDWNALITHLNSNSGDINRFGFVRGGARSGAGTPFFNINNTGYYWSLNEQGITSAHAYTTTGGNVSNYSGGLNKRQGSSVRCIVK
jgi:hypothetical protein